VQGNQIRIEFDHVADGLEARGDGELSHFTIAGEDQKFVPAKAEIDGDAIVVSSDAVDKPVAVRFAWTDTAEPNLVNSSGLPASPFRTDDWELKTHGRR
jgi:sialate O-acetylesterase